MTSRGFLADLTNSFAQTTVSISGRVRYAAILALTCVALGGCAEQFQKGYILPEGALEQIPIGASQDQVLLVMGTPSTVATLNGEVSITSRNERNARSLSCRRRSSTSG